MLTKALVPRDLGVWEGKWKWPYVEDVPRSERRVRVAPGQAVFSNFHFFPGSGSLVLLPGEASRSSDLQWVGQRS